MVKANSPPVAFRNKPHGLIPFLFFFLFLFISFVFALSDSPDKDREAEWSRTSVGPSPPTFLTALTDQDGKVPLFWFSPHPETSEIAYHQDGMLKGFFVLTPWRENRVSVKMSSSLLPFYLLRSKIHISHHGAHLDTNYNFKAPFFVTINPDSDGYPQNDFLDSVTASASGVDTLSDGEWVEVEHNLLMTDSVFWIVFHWNEDTPLSPLVGEDSLPNVGNSFWGKRTFFHVEWHPCEYNLMIRAEVVTNSDTGSDVDSFRIYRSTDSSMSIDQSDLIATVAGLQFQYTDSEVAEDQTYFYQVTSVISPEESQGSNQAQATPRRGAELVADKNKLFISLSWGEQIFDSLTLTNSGGLPLRFKVQINMEEKDWMGGSDRFGYIWTDNDRQPELEFAWANIEDSGVAIGESGDNDQDYGFFSLDFPFPFYGNSFDSIKIASDGWLSFSSVIPCYTDSFLCYVNKCLPYLWGPYNLLAPFWDDLKLTDSSVIYFYSNGDSAIISFLNLHRLGQAGGGPYTFQVIIISNGEITFQYGHIPDPKYSATVGIQNRDGTIGLEIFCNQDSLHDSQTIKIRPSWVRVGSMEGWIQPGESKVVNLTFDPLTYPGGIYHADLLIEGWDKNHQLETLIIPLTVGIDTGIDTTTSVNWIDSQRAEKIVLWQNFPNPFNPVTKIQYTVGGRKVNTADGGPSPRDGPFLHTTLKIYNILGQRVRTLVDQAKKPGDYEVIWDGKDDQGKEVGSGIYFCKLTVGASHQVRKMVLLK